jgi:hypothetical protein
MDATAFLNQYGFDLADRPATDWIQSWEQRYSRAWVASALVEALYQGRYKAISVEQLLAIWSSRGCPRVRFGLEFGRKVWPEGLDWMQAVLEQVASPTLSVRRYNFEPFEANFYSAAEQEPAITAYPLRRSLRQQLLPAKLKEFLCR